MAQARVVNVGFRTYEVHEITATTTQKEMLFERTCDFIRVANLGSVDVKVRFSKVLNDPITVRPGTMVELPIQTNKMFYVSASVAGISADIEVMGFSE